jgi:hypothetical protein
MTYSARLLLITALTACAQTGIAQAPSLPDLFTHSDRVALVRAWVGNTDANNVYTIEAHVIKGFKGLSYKDTLSYRAPFKEPTGRDRFVFLADTPEIRASKAKIVERFGAVSVSAVKFSGVFKEAYPSMLISWVCVFGGPKCDEGVKVCPDQFELPSSLPSFPPDSDDRPLGCRWVRKAAFIAFLDNLIEATK